MSIKETRKSRFKNYRSTIESEENSVSNQANTKKQLNPLISSVKSKHEKNLFFYYTVVTIFAILVILMLLFLGMRWLWVLIQLQ